MFTLVRKSWRFFGLLTAAALVLRLFFVWKFATWDGDPLFYGDLAKNWLQHGILGTSHAGGVQPSLIRLPGYPAFLAAIWAVTGVEHYRAVLIVQAFADVITCFVTADLLRRAHGSERAVKLAFLLAALCPFTANYAACALAETLAILLAACALDLAAAAVDTGSTFSWAACGAAVGAGILLRPDGGILWPLIGLYGLAHWVWGGAGDAYAPLCDRFHRALLHAALFSAVALAPLVPWTLRNWRDFHVWQPLAPRYANDPGQFVPLGFQRWVKTWIIDYASVPEIYWPLEEDRIDLAKAPQRAFDSPQERQAVSQLFDRYNTAPRRDWTPELDAGLNRIASVRIGRHAWRYYLLLPLARVADMWLRPRTEMLGVDDRWWERADGRDTAIALALAGLNLFYVGAAAGAAVSLLWRACRFGATRVPLRHWELWLAFLLARSLFLGSLENPEPRYTLECYPVVIALAAVAWGGAKALAGASVPQSRDYDARTPALRPA
jgi:4-amino-4-deoxy-L-arabinose transferase-like glycosyltransferase